MAIDRKLLMKNNDNRSARATGLEPCRLAQ
jgi:hypothetical protein